MDTTSPKQEPSPRRTDVPSAPRPERRRLPALLPAEKGWGRLLRSPLGEIFAKPWLDRAIVWLLFRWFFPLSRLWAMARLANGSPDAYFRSFPGQETPREVAKLKRALGKFEAARAAAAAAEAVWDHAMFGPEPVSQSELVQAEMTRRDCRHKYNGTRRHFRFLLRRRNVPKILRAVPTPAECEAIYGDTIGDPAAAVAPPAPMPAIEVSRKVPGEVGTHYWLRFPSPSPRTGDKVYVRVMEPAGVADPPTLLFGHGICVEFDHWHGLVDEVEVLVKMGFRVVRPEAPWHGRRVLPGEFGGEHMLGTAPVGSLDLFLAAVREWSVVMAWCRSNSSGPVAMGGSSLGALTAQLAADRARDWPENLQPDALLLITHCGRLEDTVFRARIGDKLRIRQEAEARGWTPDDLSRYLPLLGPTGGPVVPAHRIVSILGTRDEVTPFSTGKPLIDGWGVPEENRFIWRRGHFSVPLTLMRRRAPLDRFKAIMLEVGAGR